MMRTKFNRRTFFGSGAMALSLAAAGKVTAGPRTRKADDLLKIGLILGEWAHSTGWGAMMNGIEGDKTYPKKTGMIYTHVWHIDHETAVDFAQKYGVANVVKSFDDMIGKVDGLIIDTLFQTPWVYKIARPYLEAGIPVFSDRPFADAVWKVKETIEIAKKHKTPFWSGSSLEHMQITYEAAADNPPESILGYETWSEGVPDYYSHGLHGLWWTYATTGGGIHAIAHKTEAWEKGGGTSSIVHKDRGNGPYMGKVIHQKRDKNLIHTTFKGNDMVYRYGLQGYWDIFVYLPLLLKVQNMFYYGEEGLPQSYEAFLEKCTLFIAGFRSILRENGDFVELAKLDEDWSVGCPWGQIHMPGIDIYRAYTKLLGPEKGEIRPPA